MNSNSLMSEWKLRDQVCEIGRRLYAKGFAAASDGNISHRLGEACGHLELVREEADAFRRVTLLAPEMAVAQNNLGYACYRMGKYRDAVSAYNEAVRLAPDFAVAYDNLGASPGGLVGLSEGREVANPFGKGKAPVDAYCACVTHRLSL